MRRLTSRLLLAGGVVTGLLVAERLLERNLARKVRAASDPELDPLFELPADAVTFVLDADDGGTIHVIERGHGRPLVLLHGVTLQAEAWAPLMHLLGDHFRVLAIDVRGHGLSAPGSNGIGRLQAADDLATLLEQLDLRDAIVMGHSMGGMILGEFCRHHHDVLDERVAGLVFMSTAVSELVLPIMSPAVLAGAARLRRRVEAGRRVPRVISDNDRSLLVTRTAFGARPPGAAVAQATRLGAAVDERYYLPLWIDLLDYDGESALDSVDLPALVLVGSRDTLTPVRSARRIVEHLEHGELHVMRAAGHQLTQERPREVADLLIELDHRLAADRA
ncbi:MAG: alpha/beta fold hydrolase [Acidimicrobiales bacterium]